MKKLIEVKEITINPGDLYKVEKYPALGMYIVNGGTLVVVYRTGSGATAACCCQLGSVLENNSMFIEQTDAPPVEPSGGIDQDTFLKTVAIIRNPELGSKLFD